MNQKTNLQTGLFPRLSLRVISLFTVIAFLCSDLLLFPTQALAQIKEPSNVRGGVDASLLASASAASGNAQELVIPSGIGTITEQYEVMSLKPGEKIKTHASNSQPRSVFLIQDAHSIPDAQKSIEKLIEYLQNKYGVTTIALEGAQGKLDPTLFRAFPDEKKLHAIFDSHLDSGELSGATVASVFSPRKTDYIGIEDWKLYQKGLEAFLAGLEQQDASKFQISKLKSELQKLKQKYYSPKALEFDSQLAAWHADPEGFPRLLNDLLKFKLLCPPGSVLTPFFQALENEKTGLSPSIENEIKELAVRMDHSIKNGPERIRLNALKQAFRTGSIGRVELACELYALSRHPASNSMPDVEKALSHELQALIADHEKIVNLKGPAFSKELDDFLDRVRETFFLTPEAKAVAALDGQLRLLDNLIRFELSRKEWQSLQPDAGYRMKDGAKDPEIREMHQKILSVFTSPYTADFLSFYETALKRETIFLKQLNVFVKASSDNHRPSPIIFVAGGFHTDGLAAKLREQGIPYAVISPAIKEIPQDERYPDHMRGKVSWANYFQPRDGRIDLYDAFARASTDRLLSADSGQGPAFREKLYADGYPLNAKEWRDAIIRDLAAQGQVADHGKYTRYIDTAVADQSEEFLALKEKWSAKLEKFIENLRLLRGNNQLTEANVAKLLGQPANQTPYAVPMVPGMSVPADWMSSEFGVRSESLKREATPDSPLPTQDSTAASSATGFSSPTQPNAQKETERLLPPSGKGLRDTLRGMKERAARNFGYANGAGYLFPFFDDFLDPSKWYWLEPGQREYAEALSRMSPEQLGREAARYSTWSTFFRMPQGGVPAILAGLSYSEGENESEPMILQLVTDPLVGLTLSAENLLGRRSVLPIEIREPWKAQIKQRARHDFSVFSGLLKAVRDYGADPGSTVSLEESIMAIQFAREIYYRWDPTPKPRSHYFFVPAVRSEVRGNGLKDVFQRMRPNHKVLSPSAIRHPPSVVDVSTPAQISLGSRSEVRGGKVGRGRIMPVQLARGGLDVIFMKGNPTGSYNELDSAENWAMSLLAPGGAYFGSRGIEFVFADRSEVRMNEMSRKVVFKNPQHMHVLPSTVLVMFAMYLRKLRGIDLAIQKGEGSRIPVKDTMEVAGLGIKDGDRVRVSLRGDHSEAVLEAVLKKTAQLLQDFDALEGGPGPGAPFNAYADWVAESPELGSRSEMRAGSTDEKYEQFETDLFSIIQSVNALESLSNVRIWGLVKKMKQDGTSKETSGASEVAEEIGWGRWVGHETRNLTQELLTNMSLYETSGDGVFLRLALKAWEPVREVMFSYGLIAEELSKTSIHTPVNTPSPDAGATKETALNQPSQAEYFLYKVLFEPLNAEANRHVFIREIGHAQKRSDSITDYLRAVRTDYEKMHGPLPSEEEAVAFLDGKEDDAVAGKEPRAEVIFETLSPRPAPVKEDTPASLIVLLGGFMKKIRNEYDISWAAGWTPAKLQSTVALLIPENEPDSKEAVALEADLSQRWTPYRLIREAVENSLNAYGRDGREGLVHFKLLKEGGAYVLEVSDDGPGFPKDGAQAAAASPRAQIKAHGLGLETCRAVTEARGGVFEILSPGKEGHKVTVRFSFPENVLHVARTAEVPVAKGVPEEPVKPLSYAFRTWILDSLNIGRSEVRANLLPMTASVQTFMMVFWKGLRAAFPGSDNPPTIDPAVRERVTNVLKDALSFKDDETGNLGKIIQLSPVWNSLDAAERDALSAMIDEQNPTRDPKTSRFMSHYRKTYQQLSKGPNEIFLLVDPSGRVTGHGSAEVHLFRGSIYDLWTYPKAEKRGTFLMSGMLGWLRKIGLKEVVWISDIDAMGFYHKFLGPRMDYSVEQKHVFRAYLDTWGRLAADGQKIQADYLQRVKEREADVREVLDRINREGGEYMVRSNVGSGGEADLRIRPNKKGEMQWDIVGGRGCYWRGSYFKPDRKDMTLRNRIAAELVFVEGTALYEVTKRTLTRILSPSLIMPKQSVTGRSEARDEDGLPDRIKRVTDMLLQEGIKPTVQNISSNSERILGKKISADTIWKRDWTELEAAGVVKQKMFDPQERRKRREILLPLIWKVASVLRSRGGVPTLPKIMASWTEITGQPFAPTQAILRKISWAALLGVGVHKAREWHRDAIVEHRVLELERIAKIAGSLRQKNIEPSISNISKHSEGILGEKITRMQVLKYGWEELNAAGVKKMKETKPLARQKKRTEELEAVARIAGELKERGLTPTIPKVAQYSAEITGEILTEMQLRKYTWEQLKSCGVVRGHQVDEGARERRLERALESLHGQGVNYVTLSRQMKNDPEDPEVISHNTLWRWVDNHPELEVAKKVKAAVAQETDASVAQQAPGRTKPRVVRQAPVKTPGFPVPSVVQGRKEQQNRPEEVREPVTVFIKADDPIALKSMEALVRSKDRARSRLILSAEKIAGNNFEIVLDGTEAGKGDAAVMLLQQLELTPENMNISVTRHGSDMMTFHISEKHRPDDLWEEVGSLLAQENGENGEEDGTADDEDPELRSELRESGSWLNEKKAEWKALGVKQRTFLILKGVVLSGSVAFFVGEAFADHFLKAFLTIFFVVNPLGSVTTFVSMTGSVDHATRKILSKKSLIAATGVGALFLLAGNHVFHFMGITLGTFMIAGGALLFTISLNALTAGSKERQIDPDEMGVVPLGVPLIVGPATLTTLMVLRGQFGWPVVASAFLFNMIATAVLFRYSEKVTEKIGKEGAKVIGKVFNVLLAAIGVTLVIKGLLTVFPDLRSDTVKPVRFPAAEAPAPRSELHVNPYSSTLPTVSNEIRRAELREKEGDVKPWGTTLKIEENSVEYDLSRAKEHPKDPKEAEKPWWSWGVHGKLQRYQSWWDAFRSLLHVYETEFDRIDAHPEARNILGNWHRFHVNDLFEMARLRNRKLYERIELLRRHAMADDRDGLGKDSWGLRSVRWLHSEPELEPLINVAEQVNRLSHRSSFEKEKILNALAELKNRLGYSDALLTFLEAYHDAYYQIRLKDRSATHEEARDTAFEQTLGAIFFEQKLQVLFFEFVYLSRTKDAAVFEWLKDPLQNHFDFDAHIAGVLKIMPRRIRALIDAGVKGFVSARSQGEGNSFPAAPSRRTIADAPVQEEFNFFYAPLGRQGGSRLGVIFVLGMVALGVFICLPLCHLAAARLNFSFSPIKPLLITGIIAAIWIFNRVQSDRITLPPVGEGMPGPWVAVFDEFASFNGAHTLIQRYEETVGFPFWTIKFFSRDGDPYSFAAILQTKGSGMELDLWFAKDINDRKSWVKLAGPWFAIDAEAPALIRQALMNRQGGLGWMDSRWQIVSVPRRETFGAPTGADAVSLSGKNSDPGDFHSMRSESRADRPEFSQKADSDGWTDLKEKAADWFEKKNLFFKRTLPDFRLLSYLVEHTALPMSHKILYSIMATLFALSGPPVEASKFVIIPTIALLLPPLLAAPLSLIALLWLGSFLRMLIILIPIRLMSRLFLNKPIAVKTLLRFNFVPFVGAFGSVIAQLWSTMSRQYQKFEKISFWRLIRLNRVISDRLTEGKTAISEPVRQKLVLLSPQITFQVLDFQQRHSRDWNGKKMKVRRALHDPLKLLEKISDKWPTLFIGSESEYDVLREQVRSIVEKEVMARISQDRIRRYEKSLDRKIRHTVRAEIESHFSKEIRDRNSEKIKSLINQETSARIRKRVKAHFRLRVLNRMAAIPFYALKWEPLLENPSSELNPDDCFVPLFPPLLNGKVNTRSEMREGENSSGEHLFNVYMGVGVGTGGKILYDSVPLERMEDHYVWDEDRSSPMRQRSATGHDQSTGQATPSELPSVNPVVRSELRENLQAPTEGETAGVYGPFHLDGKGRITVPKQVLEKHPSASGFIMTPRFNRQGGMGIWPVALWQKKYVQELLRLGAKVTAAGLFALSDPVYISVSRYLGERSADLDTDAQGRINLGQKTVQNAFQMMVDDWKIWTEMPREFYIVDRETFFELWPRPVWEEKPDAPKARSENRVGTPEEHDLPAVTVEGYRYSASTILKNLQKPQTFSSGVILLQFLERTAQDQYLEQLPVPIRQKVKNALYVSPMGSAMERAFRFLQGGEYMARFAGTLRIGISRFVTDQLIYFEVTPESEEKLKFKICYPNELSENHWIETGKTYVVARERDPELSLNASELFLVNEQSAVSAGQHFHFTVFKRGNDFWFKVVDPGSSNGTNVSAIIDPKTVAYPKRQETLETFRERLEEIVAMEPEVGEGWTDKTEEDHFEEFREILEQCKNLYLESAEFPELYGQRKEILKKYFLPNLARMAHSQQRAEIVFDYLMDFAQDERVSVSIPVLDAAADYARLAPRMAKLLETPNILKAPFDVRKKAIKALTKFAKEEESVLRRTVRLVTADLSEILGVIEREKALAGKAGGLNKKPGVMGDRGRSEVRHADETIFPSVRKLMADGKATSARSGTGENAEMEKPADLSNVPSRQVAVEFPETVGGPVTILLGEILTADQARDLGRTLVEQGIAISTTYKDDMAHADEIGAAYLASLNRKAQGKGFFAAFRGNKPAGLISFELMANENQETEAAIGEIQVWDSRQGIGKQLFKTLKNYLRDLGVVELSVLIGNTESAQKFWPAVIDRKYLVANRNGMLVMADVPLNSGIPNVFEKKIGSAARPARSEARGWQDSPELPASLSTDTEVLAAPKNESRRDPVTGRAGTDEKSRSSDAGADEDAQLLLLEQRGWKRINKLVEAHETLQDHLNILVFNDMAKGINHFLISPVIFIRGAFSSLFGTALKQHDREGVRQCLSDIRFEMSKLKNQIEMIFAPDQLVGNETVTLRDWATAVLAGDRRQTGPEMWKMAEFVKDRLDIATQVPLREYQQSVLASQKKLETVLNEIESLAAGDPVTLKKGGKLEIGSPNLKELLVTGFQDQPAPDKDNPPFAALSLEIPSNVFCYGEHFYNSLMRKGTFDLSKKRAPRGGRLTMLLGRREGIVLGDAAALESGDPRRLLIIRAIDVDFARAQVRLQIFPPAIRSEARDGREVTALRIAEPVINKFHDRARRSHEALVDSSSENRSPAEEFIKLENIAKEKGALQQSVREKKKDLQEQRQADLEIERRPLKRHVVTIDGPSGTGKGTAAKSLAKQLDFMHIDLGMIYRALTLKVLEQKLNADDSAIVDRLVANTVIDLQRGEQTRIICDGIDVTEKIRTPEVDKKVPDVARHAAVAKFVFQTARRIGESQNIVIEGRNAGTDIFPDATAGKFYLVTDLEERARRRWRDYQKERPEITFEEVKKDLVLRDKKDTERETAPLRRAPDAVEIDNTRLEPFQVVDRMATLVREKMNKLQVATGSARNADGLAPISVHQDKKTFGDLHQRSRQRSEARGSEEKRIETIKIRSSRALPPFIEVERETEQLLTANPDLLQSDTVMLPVSFFLQPFERMLQTMMENPSRYHPVIVSANHLDIDSFFSTLIAANLLQTQMQVTKKTNLVIPLIKGSRSDVEPGIRYVMEKIFGQGFAETILERLCYTEQFGEVEDLPAHFHRVQTDSNGFGDYLTIDHHGKKEGAPLSDGSVIRKGPSAAFFAFEKYRESGILVPVPIAWMTLYSLLSDTVGLTENMQGEDLHRKIGKLILPVLQNTRFWQETSLHEGVASLYEDFEDAAHDISAITPEDALRHYKDDYLEGQARVNEFLFYDTKKFFELVPGILRVMRERMPEIGKKAWILVASDLSERKSYILSVARDNDPAIEARMDRVWKIGGEKALEMNGKTLWERGELLRKQLVDKDGTCAAGLFWALNPDPADGNGFEKAVKDEWFMSPLGITKYAQEHHSDESWPGLVYGTLREGNRPAMMQAIKTLSLNAKQNLRKGAAWLASREGFVGPIAISLTQGWGTQTLYDVLIPEDINEDEMLSQMEEWYRRAVAAEPEARDLLWALLNGISIHERKDTFLFKRAIALNRRLQKLSEQTIPHREAGDSRRSETRVYSDVLVSLLKNKPVSTALPQFVKMARLDLSRVAEGLRASLREQFVPLAYAEMTGGKTDLATGFAVLDRLLREKNLTRQEIERLADQMFANELESLAETVAKKEINGVSPVIFYAPQIKTHLVRFIETVQEAFEKTGDVTGKNYRITIVSENRADLAEFKTELSKRGALRGLKFIENQGADTVAAQLASAVTRHPVFGDKFGVFFPESDLGQNVAWQRVVRSEIPKEYSMLLLPALSRYFATVSTSQINATTLRQALPDLVASAAFRVGQGIAIVAAFLDHLAAAEKQIAASA